MRNFGQCVLVFLLFLLATVAVLEVDQQCREMTGRGGSITAAAGQAAAAAEASAEFIVEKMGSLG